MTTDQKAGTAVAALTNVHRQTLPAPIPAAADIHDRITEAYYGKMGDAFMRKTQERIHWICENVLGDTVLDVGCSQGIVPILLGREGKSVVGIDSDSSAIDVALDYLALEPGHVQARVTLLNSNFLTHDFKAERFGTVVMSEVLEHLVNPQEFVAAAAALLPDEGRFVVTVPFGINDFIDHKRTYYLLGPYALLSELFEIRSVRIFGQWIGLVGVKRKKTAKAATALHFSQELLEKAETAIHTIERELRDKIAELSTKLADANQKYRTVTKQATALKQKAAGEEAARQAAASQLQQLQAQLEQASHALQAQQAAHQAELARERQALQDQHGAHQTQLETLRGDVKTHSEATHEAQKQLIRAEAQLEALRTQLADANQKYRTVTEQATALKQKAAGEEAARQAAASQLQQLQAQLEQASQALQAQQAAHQAELARERQALQDQHGAHQTQLETLRGDVKTHSEATHEAQKQFIRAEAQLEALRTQLADANQKYRTVTEQATALKQKAAGEEAARQAAASQLQQLQAQLEQASQALQAQQAAHQAELARERQALQDQQAALQARHQADLVHAEQALRAEQNALQQQVQALETRLDDANQKYRASTTQYAALKADFASHVSLSDVQQKTQAMEAGQLQRNLQDAQKNLLALRREVDRLRQAKAQAEGQVAKTRAMLSFRLGYALLHGFKSFRAFSQLPGQLLALRRDAVARKRNRQNFPPPALLAPQRPMAVATNLALVPSSKPVAQLAADNVGSGQALRALRMACIMDEFTFSSYGPECNLLQLSVPHWQHELTQFKPELLFIESAWRGKDEQWGSKVGHTSTEVVGIVEWCRANGVPTVFWNKEDPVHFETFLTTAKLFDHVFTTDIDCIHRYKAALGHDRVYLLPFACQPAASNPIEKYPRKDAFCFAGAYYVRYPERTRDLGNFMTLLSEYRPVEIYDRNFGKDDVNYQFPPEYQPFIVGNLPFDQIDKAYKGYHYAINLNSIKQSQTMFARRVYELLASNTITVSNFSRGVRLLFGDLVITTDNGAEIVRRLQALGGDETRLRKFRLAGLRKVMQGHTYQDRLAYVVSRVQGKPQPSLLPRIVVTAYAKNQRQLEALLASYQRQTHAGRRMVLVVPTGFEPMFDAAANTTVQILQANTLDGLNLRALGSDAEWVAGMVPDDYYGPNYLLDLALATRYSTAPVIGKVTHHVWSDAQGLSLAYPGCQYTPARNVQARCALMSPGLLDDMPLRDWVVGLYTQQLEATDMLSVDEFNYCKNGSHPRFDAAQAQAVNDLPGLDHGLAIEALTTLAENIAPAEAAPDAAPWLSGQQLASHFKPPASGNVRYSEDGTAWAVESTLDDGKHEYLYASTDLRPADLEFGPNAQFHLDATPGLNLQMVVLFLDAHKQRIGHVVKSANRNHEATKPTGTEWVRLGLRVYGSGAARINGLVLGHRPLRPAQVLGRAEHLVLTNHYPADDDLYRNGFVHTRVAAYAQRGIKVDVFRLRTEEALSYHEFHNVDVITGSQEALHKLLQTGHYKSVLVHFLSEAMWGVLQHYIDRVKVVVWVHGAEIQPWHRRDYNHQTEDQRNAAKAQSQDRMHFWRGLLHPMPANLQLVFVSKYFAEEVMEDLGFRLPTGQYHVIHNPIDTELFAYHPKPPEQRKKILSIRPYASRTYANDLSVQAILALLQKPWFKELEFRLIGDGPLFDEVLAPLRGLANVIIERRFLTQPEIAQLHREYGVFLCPTRMDTQGVSRDEAMASGLVPLTNAVAAIPEFVDEACGILAPGEAHMEMAQGLEALFEKPALFEAMSRGAAERVGRQSAAGLVIASELKLFALDREG